MDPSDKNYFQLAIPDKCWTGLLFEVNRYQSWFAPQNIFLLFTLRISRQISHKEIVCRFKSFRKSAQQRCLTLSGSSFWSESWECRDARPHSEGGTQFSWSVWNWKRVSLKKFRKENHFSWGWFVFKPVNATRSEQGGVKDVNPVCGHDHLARRGSSSLETDWYK